MHVHNYEINNYQSLPFLFLTSKFHKTPIKFRFISYNSKGIGKRFNIKLQVFLKRIYGFLQFKFKTNIYFWCIDNSNEVLNELNTPTTPTNLHTFDFENHFFNIPIDLLYNNLKNHL